MRGSGSLRWQLVPAIWLLNMLVFGLLLVFSVHTLLAYDRERLQQRAQTLSVELRAALLGPVIERDFVTLDEVLRELVTLGEIDYLLVLGADGREMARAGRVPADVLDAAAARGPGAAAVADADGVLDFSTPVAQATVYGGLRAQQAGGLWVELGQRLGWAALLASVLVALLTAAGAMWLARRIERLQTMALRFAQGDLDVRVAPGRSRDEIARLGHTFNQLAAEASRRIHDLQSAQQQSAAASAQLATEHAHLEALLSTIKLGVLLVDRQDRVLYLNAALRRMWLIEPGSATTGALAHQLLAQSGGRLAQPDHFSRLVLQVPGTQEISDSTELVMVDGRTVVQICHPVRDEHERLIGRLWLYDDVTQERRDAEQLIYLAERDGLTGLINRRRFEELLDRALHDAQRRSSRCALLLFDLDEFKYLNDHFGHRAGDALLVRVANELAQCVRGNEVIARLGGDEFALLVPDCAQMEEAQRLAERITRMVARIPFSFDGRDLRVTLSLGVAVFPDHAQTLPDLVVAADVAMYQAKNAGKNGWHLYSGPVQLETIERLGWSDRIERAFAENLFELHFQGIHDAQGRLLHAEALVRLRDATHGNFVLPQHFIAPAEKTGRIIDIDRWVLRAACQTLRDHPQLPGVGVNLSARSLADPGFPSYVLDQLREHGVPPSRLLLEVTETTAISDVQDANRLLQILRPAGCRICLDDFGAGFSSFAYLKHLAVDVIKIDGQFVRGIADDRDNRLVVKAIVDMAHGLGKTTVAEFVEDERSVHTLRQLGVDAFQGYHFSRPSADIVGLLARRA